MKSSLWFVLAALLVIASAVCAVMERPVCAAACAIGALAAIVFAYRVIALYMRIIGNGMDLLKSQDFASRLRRVGQRDADRVVDLYNSLIGSMKAERLRNREQDRFLGKLVEASPTGIAICDLDGRIERTNEAFRRLSSPELLEAIGRLGEEEQMTVRPSGTQVLRCSRLYFMDRGFRRPFFLVERLTDEIVRAEADVFHKIVRTMGHEVNNTLGGVVSVLESVAAIHSEDSDIVKVLDSCRLSCLRLGDFVRGYSDVVKLPEPKPVDINLGRVIDEALPFLKNICPANIDIRVEAAGDTAPVRLDPVLIQRVLINAVKNSVESIGAGEGLIRLRVEGRKIEICDNGHGISPDVAPLLFTPFFSTKHPDRGLGLMLVADILRRHNAAFSLSTAGSETVFRIDFPEIER